MIILIKKSPDLTTAKHRKLRALENILASFGECRHVVWMPVQIASELMAQKDFGEYSRRVLVELKSFVTESRGIENLFSFHLNVDFDNGNRLEIENDKVLNIGYLHLTDSMQLRKSILLTENLRDAEIFKIGSEAYLFSENLYRVYGISLEQMPGGGNTTYDLFGHLEKNEIFFLCIIDSDLKHPKGPKGSTAKRFSTTPIGHLNKRFLKILECHEIENIIPLSIVKEATNGLVENGLIYKLDRAALDRTHPDHKAGLTVSNAIANDHEYGSDHWSQYYPYEVADRDVWIIPPLGENLLSNCLKIMAQESIGKLSEKISQELDRTWIDVAQSVASWGVSMRRRVN